MQVILLERVPKLGQMGQVVTVKDGFARNFLIPGGKALRATKRALDDFEKRRRQLEATNIEQRQDAEQLAGKVEGRSVVILRQASESSQLYGSVSARDIATAFTEVRSHPGPPPDPSRPAAEDVGHPRRTGGAASGGRGRSRREHRPLLRGGRHPERRRPGRGRGRGGRGGGRRGGAEHRGPHLASMSQASW